MATIKQMAVLWLQGCIMLAIVSTSQAQTTNVDETLIYTTTFDASEGYSLTNTLAGQNGWVSYGSGGNGLVDNFFTNQNQQAFIGFAPPFDTNDTINVWRPFVVIPATNAYPRLRFTVSLAIIDSNNKQYDDFRWSAYNLQEHRFFSLDFDNNTFLISYALDDDAGFRSTGIKFQDQLLYELTIDFNLLQNTWSAFLDQTQLVSNLPITTTNASLNLSDIDAVWAIHDPSNPGDNYMLFDNYRIVANTSLERLVQPSGTSLMWGLYGKPNRAYVIEASPDFLQWSSLLTNSTSATGFFQFSDDAPPAWTNRFLRARLLP